MIARECQSMRRFAQCQRCLVLFLQVLSSFTTFIDLDDFMIACKSRYSAGMSSEVLLPLRKPQQWPCERLSDVRLARVYVPHARVYAFAVSKDKTRPMQCRSGYTGAQCTLGERQREKE